MAEDAEWGLVEPFDVDNGQLDGLTAAECFTLGVEWQMFRAKLDEDGSFVDQVHTANADRLMAMARRRGKQVTRHWLHDDYADWCTLCVS